MKNIFKTLIILGLVGSATSCKKYLDVNTNPNDITAATPELVLPQALTATAAVSQRFNLTYGGNLGGYIANAGGVSGFGNFETFSYTSGDFTTVWTDTFDNLQDYQFILNNTTPTGPYKNYNAVARLMKAMCFLKLVDAYGDVPYSQALLGASNILPAYDKGADVYKACIGEIDAAIAQFTAPNVAATLNLATSTLGTVDVTKYSATTAGLPLSGDGVTMTNWIKFANTLKLRALIRIQKADPATYNAFKGSMQSLTSLNGFISADVLINPGYVQQSGKQNPLWNGFAYTYTGTNSTKSYIPTTFITAFYNGTKLTDGKRATATVAGVSTINVTPIDNGRGNLIYRDYLHSNQLGYENINLALQPANPTGGDWYVGTTLTGNGVTGSPTGTAATGYGVEKGFDQGQPIMLAAESYFLQAEGAQIGLLPAVGATSAALFDSGITASFNYLDKDHNDNVSSVLYVAANNAPATQLANYKASNPASYLVNFNLATTDEQRLEAIITQKYIALNFLNCDEGWNEFRRTYNTTLKTGYPRSVPPSDPTSNSSNSFSPNVQNIATTRADGLAGRILYPTSELQYNTANVPAINGNSTLVFWDARPTN